MIIVNEDKSISITRGDAVTFTVSADIDGERRLFVPGDVVRIKVFEKKNAENVVLQKDFAITYEQEYVAIYLSGKDTKIGDVISKAVDYWYEIELNPFTDPQTIVGYDEDGPKVFKLFPEGNDIPIEYPAEEDIPVVDAELDMTSTRPVQNQAVAREITKLTEAMKNTASKDDLVRADIREVPIEPGGYSADYKYYKCVRIGALVVIQFYIEAMLDETGGLALFVNLPCPDYPVTSVAEDNNGSKHNLELTTDGTLWLSRELTNPCVLSATFTYLTYEP